MMRKRQTETDVQGAKRKNTMQECVSKQQQTETEEQAAKRKMTNRDCLRRKRDIRDCNGEDITNVIDHAMKEAKHFLHRTRDPANPRMHRAIV